MKYDQKFLNVHNIKISSTTESTTMSPKLIISFDDTEYHITIPITYIKDNSFDDIVNLAIKTIENDTKFIKKIRKNKIKYINDKI